jgi:hypothetical protein
MLDPRCWMDFVSSSSIQYRASSICVCIGFMLTELLFDRADAEADIADPRLREFGLQCR